MIDHFVIGVANLEEGCRYIESELGVRPIYGGSHPGIGTHNALLSLDNGTYIEIIAPDPDQPPNLALHRYFTSWETPALAWWAIRCSELEQVKKKLAERGFDGGEVQSGSRQLDNGEILKWELLLPKVPRLEAAMPFFISWDNETIHPAQAAPSAGGLMSFSIQCRWAHLLADYESDISNLVATDPPSLSLEIANKNSHIVFTTPANFPKGVATLLNEHQRQSYGTEIDNIVRVLAGRTVVLIMTGKQADVVRLSDKDQSLLESMVRNCKITFMIG